MKVCTFGEIMLRLSPPAYQRFLQAASFDVTFGGGEANVAVSLAHYGLDSYFVTKVPRHAIGQAAVNHLRRYGVRDDFIVRGGSRIGTYFLEIGAAQRPSSVIYDRAGSAVSLMRPDEMDWTEVFEGAHWFHWTGITPALGATARACVLEACRAARAAGATVSCDLNFRKKLWTEQDAQAAMVPLMEHVDICIANEEDAERCLGFKAARSDVEAAHLEEEAYADLAHALKEAFQFEAVAVTLRESFSASRNGWSALLLDDRECVAPYRSRHYDIQVVDRVGGGDAFAAGLIYGLMMKPDTRQALEFAVAASCLKHTIPGDFNLVAVAEVENLMKGSGSGRVER
ncbi:MAG: PfkB family carbohydrate kinase [Rhodothermales bacterium]